MNTLMGYGYFPTIWKEARVALVPKEGKDPKMVTSYRPICLLSTWGKILDKVITKRLQFELEVNGKLDDCQHGFRRGKSTLSALQVFTDFIKSAKDEKLITLAIIFDISNAFNSIRWKDIMICLREDNISEYLFKIIASFLSDRKIVDHDFDISFFYDRGVPQGSSLGPVLWLLIAERLIRTLAPVQEVKLIMFADDILLLSRGSASYLFTEKLRHSLSIIEKWAQRYALSINMDKTNFIMFPFGKTPTHIPRLKIFGKTIRYSRTIKYLGLYFDEKLTWQYHLSLIKDKTQNLQGKLTRYTRATWGIKPQIIKEIYTKAIESYILYGSEIWYTDLVKLNLKLNQIQRIPLSTIVKNYRTVSTEALNILSGCPPLDIVAKAKKEKFGLIFRNEALMVQDLTLYREDFDLGNSDLAPPWETCVIPWTMDMDPGIEEYKIFTDGSKWNEQVGSGAICYDSNGQEEWSFSLRLSNNASVFIAEAIAILESIKRILHINRICYIFTDSRSVLMALASYCDQTSIIEEIKLILKDKRNIVLCWVKAHVGISGNEIADSLAKEATRRETIDINIKFSKRWLKNHFQRVIKERWQQRWEFSLKARYTYGLMPQVSTKRCFGDFYINQFLTGHGVFPVYQMRFFGKNDICHCGRDQGTITHYLYGCPTFNQISQGISFQFCQFGSFGVDFFAQVRVGLPSYGAIFASEMS
ncbi:Putative protein in type-1 retrotransposable element R1DM [Araneus ventricosus]|uniref:Retrovirus-related Pol polyprotein from type-1 retrotransposable element R1 n=1 Tax=Araneus ventricosus TaxID=182803 RepID=A0A4Y2N6I3_ARAVE|nr:Putative protein in type-1 retrotransposable element R1DM [Araneus ventricosus]